jgi:hypothetical protein
MESVTAATKKICVNRLFCVHYQHPDLEKAAAFLLDFGFVQAHKEGNRVYFKGFGVDPYIYIAEQSSIGKRVFLGGTWVVESWEDLVTAASHPNATKLEANEGPGGGSRVSILDPNGFPVTLIYGQETHEPGTAKQITRSEDGPQKDLPNSALDKHRHGGFRRFNLGPSPVHKLGHYGYVVPARKYKETLEWYTTLLNLKPTDAVYKPESGEDTTCFMHIDHGKAFTDHHVSLDIAMTPSYSPY